MAVAITMYISRFTGMFAPDSETAIGCNMRKPNNATNNGTYRVIAHPDAVETVFQLRTFATWAPWLKYQRRHPPQS